MRDVSWCDAINHHFSHQPSSVPTLISTPSVQNALQAAEGRERSGTGSPPRPRGGSKFVTGAMTLSVLLSSISILLAFFTVLQYYHTGSIIASASPPPPTAEFQCGETPSGARSRGCIFDVMSLNWLPPACYDEDLTNDFLAAGNWTFSTDPRGENRLSASQVQAGDLQYVFTSQAFHATHCVYMWRKMHRVLMSGDPDRVDGFVADMDHTKRCGGILLKNQGQDAWGIPAVIKFPLCGRRAFNEEDG